MTKFVGWLGVFAGPASDSFSVERAPVVVSGHSRLHNAEFFHLTGVVRSNATFRKRGFARTQVSHEGEGVHVSPTGKEHMAPSWLAGSIDKIVKDGCGDLMDRLEIRARVSDDRCPKISLPSSPLISSVRRRTRLCVRVEKVVRDGPD